eukprot:7344549-Prymnesium_polylepis.1
MRVLQACLPTLRRVRDFLFGYSPTRRWCPALCAQDSKHQVMADAEIAHGGQIRARTRAEGEIVEVR